MSEKPSHESEPSFETRTRQLERMTTLSGQQSDVAALYELGHDRKEIADRLDVSIGTVDSNLDRIRKKYTLAYHTSRELEPAFDNAPGDNYTGIAVYYDTDDFVVQRYVLPAIHAEHDRVREVAVTEYGLGSVLQDTPIDRTPKAIYYEDGEAVEIFHILDVADHEVMCLLAEEANMLARARLGFPLEALEDEVNE
jgi:DNA-binding CsgD family transcriptional regulator